VASDGAWTLGDAIGPGLAGTLVERSGYSTLATLSLLAAATCIVAALIVVRRRAGSAHDAAADVVDGGR
jgi:predicted MFS family arabinose efflux permease